MTREDFFTKEIEKIKFVSNKEFDRVTDDTFPCSNYFKNEITKRLYKFKNSEHYHNYSKYNRLRNFILFYLLNDLKQITIDNYIELIERLIFLIDNLNK